MKPSLTARTRGFTLLETVIAIGVLAVLLTGFMVVFTPAAEGIRKSINVQQADRLASALEQELVTLHAGEAKPPDIVTGFDKSFDWIKNSDTATSAVLVYQYRGALGGTPRPDGTPEPVGSMKDKLPGKDYIVVPMVRRKSDKLFDADMPAVEGPVYLVKCTQLVFGTDGLKLGKPGTIADPKGVSTTTITSGATYPEAVIAFSADFYQLAGKTKAYFDSKAYTDKFTNAKNPVFTRNLAVRR